MNPVQSEPAIPGQGLQYVPRAVCNFGHADAFSRLDKISAEKPFCEYSEYSDCSGARRITPANGHVCSGFGNHILENKTAAMSVCDVGQFRHGARKWMIRPVPKVTLCNISYLAALWHDQRNGRSR